MQLLMEWGQITNKSNNQMHLKKKLENHFKMWPKMENYTRINSMKR